MIKKIEIERFSLTSSKPFDQVVAALDRGYRPIATTYKSVFTEGGQAV